MSSAVAGRQMLPDSAQYSHTWSASLCVPLRLHTAKSGCSHLPDGQYVVHDPHGLPFPKSPHIFFKPSSFPRGTASPRLPVYLVNFYPPPSLETGGGCTCHSGFATLSAQSWSNFAMNLATSPASLVCLSALSWSCAPSLKL